MREKEEILLKDEHIEKILTPHPLSFMGLQSLWIFYLLWGFLLWWISSFSQYAYIFNNWLVLLAVWWGIVLFAGVVASLTAIRWRFFFMYLAILSLGTVLCWYFGWLFDAGSLKTFILLYSLCISALIALVVYAYVRSHKYIITNLRIIFKGGILKKRERTLRYDKVTDVDGSQGILGQIFDFGTIIPITQSGFGLGTDQSFAAGGVEAKGKKLGLFGLAGGGKEVTTPRARSYYELHGVYPYRDVRRLIEELVQGHVIIPYQKEQVDIQREQLELQKEMKELLEMQKRLKED
ncbi:MAG TPA: hypothetical protein ENG74_02910 [Thermoplasmatales archaeon]|nr:hypothetical protein [Thermoplasmatales archaeon]